MQTTRRKFLRNGALTLGALALSPTSLFSKPKVKSIGVQLFTFMGIIDQDTTGTLKRIAELGYVDIESAFSLKGGFYGYKPQEFNSIINDLGLKWRSHHVLGTPFVPPPDMKLPFDPSAIKSLKLNMQELVDDAAAGGIPYLTCANIAIGTADEIKSSIEILNKTSEACKKSGLTLTYHNHDAEFKPVDGLVPYVQFLNSLSKEIKFELDLAWATKGGADPVRLFNENPGRFPLWHMKDLDKTYETILPLGEGSIDFKRIFENAKKSGMKYCFVEHDFPKDAFASLATSMDYLKSNILK